MGWKRFLCAAMAALFWIVPAGALGSAGAEDPIVLTCWVYYNGVQEQEFDRLLQEFNDTVGLEQGIFVESHSQGSVTELANQVLASAKQEVGAALMPDLFAAYADTAYELLQLGVVADLSPYLTKEELDAYIGAYVEEGRMGEGNAPRIFPVAKSTELLLLNQTAWNEFAAATGADEGKLSTWEGITELGKAYFEWTDAQTPETDGNGQAFFGRDAMANYLLIGSLQLGSEIFQVENGAARINFDKDVMRKLWDHFYVPFASGWFGAYGRFRSDDIKTGQIIALVGSTSGAMYFPKEVTSDDGVTHPIDCSVRLLPNFEGRRPMATQQGAGFVVASGTPERERAAVTFLKWFTEPERNILFSLNSGYMPVTKAGTGAIHDVMARAGTEEMVRDIIETGAQIASEYELYTNKPFINGYDARTVLDTTLLDAAKAAQEERLELQAQGLSYAEAAARVTDESRFEEWYETTKAALEQALAQ